MAHDEPIFYVKPAQAKDADDLHVIFQEANNYKQKLGDYAWGPRGFSIQSVNSFITAGNTYVAYLDGIPVGTTNLEWQDKEGWGKQENGQAGYISRLAVRDSCHGQDVGKKIIEWATEQVHLNGRSLLRLDCAEGNMNLRKYYEGQGFTLVRSKDFPAYNYKAVLYEKSVRNSNIAKDFSGCKIALVTTNNKVLTYLRDNKPGLYMANKWDLPGGGKEENEAPTETILREIKEEFNVNLHPSQIIYGIPYESERFPGTLSMFMVGKINKRQIDHIDFGSEGQKYCFMSIDEYLSLQNAVPHLQVRFKEYLDKQKIAPKSD